MQKQTNIIIQSANRYKKKNSVFPFLLALFIIYNKFDLVLFP
jgi:hypothetical protein